MRKTFVVAMIVAAIGCSNRPSVDTDEKPAVIWNAIIWNAIIWNAFSGKASSNAELPGWPLRTDVFTGGGPAGDFIRSALGTEHGPMFMSYLISCALPAEAKVIGINGKTGDTIEFDGSIGLCPEWGEIDESDPGSRVSETCLELVSACLMARTNNFGVPVQLSFRGLDAWENPMVPELIVPAAPGSNPDLITSCPNPESLDCGWVADVGICQAGKGVEVSGTGCLYDQLVRVCAGTEACEEGDAIAISYSACDEPIEFECPESEDFTIMRSSTDWSGPVPVTAWGATYPATEVQLFDWREGAFYGNIFDTASLRIDAFINPDYSVTFIDRQSGDQIDPETFAPGSFDASGAFVPEPIYNMNSCYDSAWEEDSAVFLRRVCAAPDSAGRFPCAATVVGPCRNGFRKDPGVCAIDDTIPLPGDGDLDNCVDEHTANWENPITVFLNHPCDTLPGLGFCEDQ